jgi:hypothetical protein
LARTLELGVSTAWLQPRRPQRQAMASTPVVRTAISGIFIVNLLFRFNFFFIFFIVKIIVVVFIVVVKFVRRVVDEDVVVIIC